MRFYIFILLFLPSSAFPAELLGMRVGRHKGFTRLVFDFDGRIFYSMVPEHGTLRLSFLGAKYSGAGERRIMDGRVEGVSLTQMGETLLAVVHSQGRVRPKTYSIYRGGKFKVVVDLYDPPSTDLYMRRGREYFRNGLYKEALAMFRKVLASNPDHPLANLEIGRTLKAAGDYEGALRAFLEVRRSSQAWGEARAELAMLYGMLGMGEEERRCWKDVVDWVEERFGAAEDTLQNATPKKGADRLLAVIVGCAVLVGVGVGCGISKVLRPKLTEGERSYEEVGGTGELDDKAELARRMAKRGESKEAISKKLGMGLREVELALKLKGK